MRVLGIDPGSRLTGWGLVTGRAERPELGGCGAIRLVAADELSVRLAALQAALEAIVAETRPAQAAVEAPFQGKSSRSALQLAHARGVVLAVLGRAGVPVAEYSPAAVKKLVTGNGRAEKEQVRHMVARLLRHVAIAGPDDVTDALAVALCHTGSERTRALAVDGAPRTWEELLRRRAARCPR